MRIIQICGHIEGAGITKYMNELNTAFTLAGHEVKIYEFPIKDNSIITLKGNLNKNTIMFDYDNKQMVEDICNADLVLVNQLMGKKINDEYKNKFINFIQYSITKPVKVLFFNDHSGTTGGFTRMYGNYIKNKEFLMSFDKFAIHCNCNAFSRAIENCISKEEFQKRYVYMHHPHEFDENKKNNWVSLENKHKRATYIGRYLKTKHVEQVFELFKKIRNDYEFEIRGIDRLVQYIYIPDLFYDIDLSRRSIRHVDKDMIVGPSKITWSPTKKWKIENGYDSEDILIDAPHNNDRIWLFGTYKYNDGMEAMRKSMFGMEFYRLPTAEEHGDNLEYCMHEIIEQGTIPIFDSFAMKSIKYYENGKPTNESLFDKNICLCLNPDLSNWEEVKKQMDELSTNEELYNEWRNRAWDVLKCHLDPKSTAERFIEDCFKN